MSNTMLRRAVRTALAAGAVAGLAQSPAAFAQSSEDDVKDLGETQVTGSRLSRADIETAQPITVIDREDINLSGDTSVAEVLQTSVFNSFGSFRATSGFGNGQASVNEVSLRGLGSNRTLVLLDGRRISATGGSGGAAQNLNQIPLAVVDRIEILRDGASAIYGSDAIGGVINIITRRDYDGINMTYQQTAPSDGGDVTQATATVGVSSAKGNIYFSLSSVTQRPQYYRDLDYAAIAPESGGITSFGLPATAVGPSGTFLDPRCPGNIGDSAEFPNSYSWGFDDSPNGFFIGDQGPNGEAPIRCGYNFAADVQSVPRVRDVSALIKGNYELTPNLRLNTKVLVSKLNSDTRFAGTPVTTPFPVMPGFLADGSINPTNPYLLFGLTDPEDFTLSLRTVANGTRDSTIDEQIIDINFGLEGDTDWFNGSFQWQANAQFNRNQTFVSTFNLVNKEVLQNLLDDGLLDIFNVTPQGLDEDVQRQANHTGTYNADIHRLTVDVLARFDLGELPAGPVSWAWGLEYNDTDFDQVNDVESNRGVIAGSSGGDNIFVGRVNYSAFFEAAIPVLDNLDATIAGRYETYNDPGIGGDFTPQLGLAWRPLENLLVRASYGEGFRAPAFDELYGNISEGFPAGVDFYGAELGVSSAVSTQYRALTGGNPELQPEFSKSWTFGVVYSPVEGLDIDVSFYHIEFENFVTTNTLAREFNQDFQNNCTVDANDVATCNPFSAYVGGTNITRNADGSVNTISLQQNNFEGVSTEGIDFSVEYNLSTDAWGDFVFAVEAAKVLNYEQQIFADDDVADLAGLMGVPDLRINPRVSWSYGNFNVTTLGRYISGQEELAGTVLQTAASHTEIDLQVGYTLPWDATVTVGAQNLFDEEPELNADFYGWEPFDFTLYNTLGRVPYIRYEQNF
ncbi:MAG: TonB-dependent receptor plug domain-containing protein [Woeseiaceae bacterium]